MREENRHTFDFLRVGFHRPHSILKNRARVPKDGRKNALDAHGKSKFDKAYVWQIAVRHPRRPAAQKIKGVYILRRQSIHSASMRQPTITGLLI